MHAILVSKNHVTNVAWIYWYIVDSCPCNEALLARIAVASLPINAIRNTDLDAGQSVHWLGDLTLYFVILTPGEDHWVLDGNQSD